MHYGNVTDLERSHARFRQAQMPRAKYRYLFSLSSLLEGHDIDVWVEIPRQADAWKPHVAFHWSSGVGSYYYPTVSDSGRPFTIASMLYVNEYITNSWWPLYLSLVG